MRQNRITREEIDNSTITAGDFNTSLSIMDGTIRQNTNKDMEDLKNSINQLDLTDASTTPHQHDIHSSQAHRECSP